MTINGPSLFSDIAIPPGETLAEDLDFRGMSAQELADMIGQPVAIIEEIVRGERPITEDLAQRLSDALGVPAQFWLNLESHYQQTLSRLDARSATSPDGGN